MRHLFHSPSDYDPIDPKNIRVEKVSNEKKHLIEIPLDKMQDPSKPLLPAKLFRLLEERAEELLLSGEEEELEDVDDSLYLAVETFIFLLEKLKKENISEDYRFAEELSASWLTLNEHAGTDQKIKSFLQTLLRYPEKSDHTLGYYLNQYTGEKWLPFPFMDLLSKLHEDFLLFKEKSVLTRWVASLRIILKNLIEEET